MSETPLNIFVKKIRKYVPNASRHIEIYENSIITFWVGEKYVQLDPLLNEKGNLIFTSIRIAEYHLGYKIAELLITHGVIEYYEYEHGKKPGYKKYTFDYSNMPAFKDPIICVNEEELFNYLNDLDPIDLKEEFKGFSDLL